MEDDDGAEDEAEDIARMVRQARTHLDILRQMLTTPGSANVPLLLWPCALPVPSHHSTGALPRIAMQVGQQDSCGSCDDTSAAAGIRAGGGGGASGGSSSSAAMDSLPLGACGGSCVAGAPWSMRTPADSFLAAPQPEATAKVVAAAAEEAAARQVLHTCVDPVQWRLEVERVAPRLRAVQAPSGDVRDWRAHLDAAQAAAAKLDAVWPAAQAALTRLGGELSASLERVATREEQLNGQFEGLLAAYGTAREQLTAAQEEHARCGVPTGSPVQLLLHLLSSLWQGHGRWCIGVDSPWCMGLGQRPFLHNGSMHLYLHLDTNSPANACNAGAPSQQVSAQASCTVSPRRWRMCRRNLTRGAATCLTQHHWCGSRRRWQACKKRFMAWSCGWVYCPTTLWVFPCVASKLQLQQSLHGDCTIRACCTGHFKLKRVI